MKRLIILAIALAALQIQCTQDREKEQTGSTQDAALDIQDLWLKEDFGPCLKEFKLKMTCGRCPAIYLRGTLTISKEGKFESFQEERSAFCGAPPEKVKECFLKNLKQRDFPQIKGKQLPLHLGTGLAC